MYLPESSVVAGKEGAGSESKSWFPEDNQNLSLMSSLISIETLI